MKSKQLLSWAVLLVACGPLLAHPVSDSAEMPYGGPVSLEERGVGALEDVSLSEQAFPAQDGAGVRYTLLSGEINRDGVRAGLLPRGLKREVLLEKHSLLNPLGHMLGIRKQFRKRGGNTECFWKYCV